MHRRNSKCIGKCLGAVLLLTSGLRAGERVVLTSGFELHADHHEADGQVVRIFDGTGMTEMPISLIAEYRAEEFTPPTVPTSPTMVPVSPAEKISAPRDLIRALIEQKHLPPEMIALVDSVVKQESGFHQSAISPKGAIGLMQLMPATARQLGVDPRDAKQNLEAGTRYLTDLLKKYEAQPGNQVVNALAAYNAGPAAVDRYQGVPPYSETREYVRRVVKNYLDEQKIAAQQ